jgi:hypothetical protein
LRNIHNEIIPGTWCFWSEKWSENFDIYMSTYIVFFETGWDSSRLAIMPTTEPTEAGKLKIKQISETN